VPCFCRTSSGKEYQLQTKYEFSENPSIQGMWNSFTNVDPEMATAKFPLVGYFALFSKPSLTKGKFFLTLIGASLYLPTGRIGTDRANLNVVKA
jgi:hypothetical protein